MSPTKEQIFNLALSALLLQREVINTTTDKSKEVLALNIHFDVAFESTLEDLDLDSLSSPITLELIEKDPNDFWSFVYKYPTICTFLRRIESPVLVDNSTTHLSKRVGIFKGQKAIFTNECDAIGECITNDIPFAALSSNGVLAIAYKLAFLSAPLITGKGAKKLRESILALYVNAKSEAQEKDKRENFNYEDDGVRSEFVNARLS